MTITVVNSEARNAELRDELGALVDEADTPHAGRRVAAVRWQQCAVRLVRPILQAGAEGNGSARSGGRGVGRGRGGGGGQAAQLPLDDDDDYRRRRRHRTLHLCALKMQDAMF